jgi:hypothetical protein
MTINIFSMVRHHRHLHPHDVPPKNLHPSEIQPPKITTMASQEKEIDQFGCERHHYISDNALY